MIINLIKKDLRACFKADIKTIAKLLIGILIFSFILLPVSTIAIPLFISYIFIFRSFHLDELNKTDYFFNSMPIDKEDVVYAKYVFSMIIIVVSMLFTFAYSNVLKGIWYIDLVNIEIIMMTISIVLMLVSICLPIAFKYGYNKSYIIVNFIVAAIVLFTMFSAFRPRAEISIEGMEIPFIEPMYIVAVAVALVCYVVSMFVSIKIYEKKEIAN
ncbi:MAG: ABC-2 transporter permease [Peptostreptococcaceae bacterium]